MRVRALGDSSSAMRRVIGTEQAREALWTWVDRLAIGLDAVAAPRASGEPSTTARPCPAVDVRSYAAEGARVADVTGAQLDAALSELPDLVTIMAGSSELIAGRTSGGGRRRRLRGLAHAHVAIVRHQGRARHGRRHRGTVCR